MHATLQQGFKLGEELLRSVLAQTKTWGHCLLQNNPHKYFACRKTSLAVEFPKGFKLENIGLQCLNNDHWVRGYDCKDVQVKYIQNANRSQQIAQHTEMSWFFKHEWVLSWEVMGSCSCVNYGSCYFLNIQSKMTIIAIEQFRTHCYGWSMKGYIQLHQFYMDTYIHKTYIQLRYGKHDESIHMPGVAYINIHEVCSNLPTSFLKTVILPDSFTQKKDSWLP